MITVVQAIQHRAVGPCAPLKGWTSVTELKKGSRITGGDRESLAKTLRRQYEGGASIRALAEEAGRSYGFVHRILNESGTRLRGRGGATRGAKS